MKLAKFRTILSILIILAACVCLSTAQARMTTVIVGGPVASAPAGFSAGPDGFTNLNNFTNALAGSVTASGGVATGPSGAYGLAYWTVGTPAADGYAKAKIVEPANFAGVAVRINTSTGACYAFRSFNAGAPKLVRFDGASETILKEDYATNLSYNDIAGLHVSGSGATVTLTAYINGVAQTAVEDSSASRITAAGKSGIFFYTNVSTIDDWSAADGAYQ